MYEEFFGFREPPFSLHPDPDFVYLSEGHADALAHLEYAFQGRQGLAVVTGEIGAGKTTLINTVRHRVAGSVDVGVVNDTALPPDAFLRAVCDEFDLLPACRLDPLELPGLFQRHLVDRFAEGCSVALIVDEAQNLSAETLERIRLLGNLETEKHYLLQVILVGQTQLREKLASRELEQLAQRVATAGRRRSVGRGLGAAGAAGEAAHPIGGLGGGGARALGDGVGEDQDALRAVEPCPLGSGSEDRERRWRAGRSSGGGRRRTAPPFALGSPPEGAREGVGERGRLAGRGRRGDGPGRARA